MKTLCKQQKILAQLGNGNTIRNYYTGTGRYTKKSKDFVGFSINILQSLNLRTPYHYLHGNDAPKGGWSGYWLRLTAKGRQLKIVRDSIEIVEKLETLHKEKFNKKIQEENSKILPELCKQRLSNNLSKNHRKQINAEIRLVSKRLLLDVPVDSTQFIKFCQTHQS